jgi:hypothetical protein
MEQPFGIGVGGIFEEAFNGCLFNNTTGVHNNNAITHFRNNTQIVRN